MVIVIISIISVFAITRYFDLHADALVAKEKGIVAAVRSGILSYYAAHRSFPTALDSASDGDSSRTNEFFDEVIEYGVVDDWTKSGSTYFGPGGNSYVYDATNGSFD